MLDKSLENGRVSIGGINGISAGDMNAFVLADGTKKEADDKTCEALLDLSHVVRHRAYFCSMQPTGLNLLLGCQSMHYSAGLAMA